MAPETAPPDRVARLQLAGLASAADWARRYTAQVLPTWGLRPLAPTVSALVEELVTSANPASPQRERTYGDADPSRLVLTLAHTPGTLLIDVRTSASYLPKPEPRLDLVDQHARRWHRYHPPTGGSAIRAEIALGGPQDEH